jgi:hypothetical protein
MGYTLHCLKFLPETDILAHNLHDKAIKIQERSAVVFIQLCNIIETWNNN